MSITKEIVHDIARLANIGIEESDEVFLANELNSILGWIEQLKEVDVSGINLNSIGSRSAPEREDVITEEPRVEEVLVNAPDRAENWFAVPKIIACSK